MTKEGIGLISINSLHYIEHAFNTLNNGGAFINLADSQDRKSKDGLVIKEVVEIPASYGWYSSSAYVPSMSTSTAQISFTSGTEGKPKGVMISHAALANTTQRLIDIMEIDERIREYVGVPVNYSFGFGRCRAVSAAGGRFYLPEHGFNPLEISKMLETDEINAVSAVPSLWRLVLEAPEIFSDSAKKLLWIEIGSQYMSGSEKLRLREIFPSAKIIQHYGLTEASRSTFLDIQSTATDYLESVGKGFFGVETAISPEGKIKIRGPHIASSLLIDGEVKPIQDDDGWLVTNDRGHIQDGYLYFDGRMDDVINLGGIKLAPESLEASLYGQLKLSPKSLTIFKTDHAELGDQINIAILKDVKIDENTLRETILEILSAQGLKVSKNFPIHTVNSFPSTSTGKIKRKELSLLFSNEDSPKPAKNETHSKDKASDRAQELISIWQDVLKIDNIDKAESFFDLGGDSLSAIRVVVRMEKAGIPKPVCRKIFEGHSIEDILNLSGETAIPEPKADSVSRPLADKSKSLIEIWQDVLKIDNVTENDSFFDLGGDSLSAIRVVVRMEAAGIPKETCRKIFEGHSIKEIIQQSLDSAETSSASKLTQENTQIETLISIWQDVLKIDNVGAHDSFFDLGGDSLSAIRVVVRMEAAGIARDTCRKIFEGHSIQSIVSEASGVEKTADLKYPSLVSDSNKNKTAELKDLILDKEIQDAVKSNKLKRTPISSANLTLNVIRGMLVLLNIAAHWMPGVIARLPLFVNEINKYMAPLYSSGTPGFAMVFGAGLSFFVLPRFNKNKSSVNKLCARNALLLGTGMTCLAAVIVAVMYFNQTDIVSTDISNAFYSILFYYFFAVISIPVWLRILTWKGTFTASCLFMACIFYLCHLVIDALNIPPSENPLIQTGILILTPKYNYLEMSAAVMLGAATGSWIKGIIEEGRSIFPLLASGFILVAVSIIISFETGEYVQWFVWPKGLYLWTWPFYLGCILIGFYYLYRYIDIHDVNTHPITGLVLRIVSVIGIMAFPLFVGHELVLPVADLLNTFAIPGALAISLTVFFGFSIYLVNKLYRLYYASGN